MWGRIFNTNKSSSTKRKTSSTYEVNQTFGANSIAKVEAGSTVNFSASPEVGCSNVHVSYGAGSVANNQGVINRHTTAKKSVNVFNFSGNCNETLQEVESNTVINLNGCAVLTISGKVGDNSKIYLSGGSQLTLNGPVGKDVLIQASGMSEIIHSLPLPSSLQLDVSGMAKVNGPGNRNVPVKQQHYQTYWSARDVFNGDNLTIYRNNKEENSSRDYFMPKHTDNTKPKPKSKQERGRINAGNVICRSMTNSKGEKHNDVSYTNNGDATITVNMDGKSHRYRGNSVYMLLGDIYIDDKKLEAKDSRIISENSVKTKSASKKTPGLFSGQPEPSVNEKQDRPAKHSFMPRVAI